jgi:enoyl-CoA hydratase/carnithine racemase
LSEKQTQEEVLILSRLDHVALITLNRPQAMNSLNRELFARLTETIDQLERDKGVRVVLQA